MLLAVLSGFILAFAAPALTRIAGQWVGWVLALLPAALSVYFASYIPVISGGSTVLLEYAWMPGMDVSLNLMVDGLSLLFALLISGIGTFILIYAGSYLEGHPYLGRFYVIMLCFMASMLGLVLSDNLITLFVFWELTSITSYLLIGFDHESASARRSALQGLFVTSGGGLVLMAGLILLAGMSGSYSLSEILNQNGSLQEHAFYTATVFCILAGTFTKSAQVPFHFWLPNAMAAPTPVSAYLHSATMVKAGIYLMARLNPAMGDSALWSGTLMLFGSATMVTGAYLAFSSTGIKKVLAYSTIMALGTLTLLIGVGTEIALVAFVSFLVAHSLYKGALFMIAGALDHETGTKDILKMGGLRKSMPLTAFFACAAALSLAGIPPLFGFIAKELVFEATLAAPFWSGLVTAIAWLGGMLGVAVAGVVAIKPFFGKPGNTPKTPHEAPWGLLAGPAALSMTALMFGLFPVLPEVAIFTAPVINVYEDAAPLDLALWHGFNLPLLLSALSLLTALVLVRNWERLIPTLSNVNARGARFGPETGYFKFMDGITRVAAWQTRVLQNGSMGIYMTTLVLTTFVLTGYTLMTRYGLHFGLDLEDSHFNEWGIAALMVAATLFAITTRSRLGSVASIGVLGFSVALTFILFSAPDLGITQTLVETLTVILLVLVLFKLPEFVNLSSRGARLRDALVAIFSGTVMTLVVLAVNDIQFFDSISSYYVEYSGTLGQGRNIVNVILVDFRSLDTLGEIFVLALAALGVYSMIKLRAEDQHKP